MLDLSSFRNALDELERAYAKACSPEIKANAEMFSFLRSAVIHGFEFTYELSHKFMRRYLEMYGTKKEDDEEYVFRTLLRLSYEYGLITGIEPWLNFRNQRNVTSHTYNQAKASNVFSIIPDFINESRFLLKALEEQTKGKP